MKSYIKFNCKSFKINFQGRNDSKNNMFSFHKREDLIYPFKIINMTQPIFLSHHFFLTALKYVMAWVLICKL